MYLKKKSSRCITANFYLKKKRKEKEKEKGPRTSVIYSFRALHSVVAHLTRIQYSDQNDLKPFIKSVFERINRAPQNQKKRCISSVI